jgi:transposase-like protein
MVRPYSNDLRERVVAAVTTGQSCRVVADRFDIAVSSVVKWSQRYRATGRRARQDGRASSAGFGAAPRLHRRADRANLASDVAPAEGRTGGSRRDGFPQCDLAVHAPGRPELQKKHYLRLSKAASTLPGEERAGRLGKIASIPSGSSSSTKPGSKPTWPRCEVGGRRASDCTALLRMVVGAP